MKDNITQEEIGKRVAQMRRAKKMTQEKLAETLEVTPKHISHVERGCGALSISAMIEICRIFGCSLDYLVFGNSFDKALSQIPGNVLEVLYSGTEESTKRLRRYLEIYSELIGEQEK